MKVTKEVKLEKQGDLEGRLWALIECGVKVIDPRQTYIDHFVKLDRIEPGAVLHPGTRLLGPRTFVGAGAQVGIEGPAILDNTVLAEESEVASGYLKETVLLKRARIGSNGHIRTGTLLEEEASTAHAVGLKHTVLMSFVTMGSLINFCDGLIYGGKARNNHTEVGSGFIHFNFTPWGQQGDKATPTIIGNVPRGVFLREPRIFLGGLGGLVGPTTVGFGSFTVAGQVVRTDVPEGRIVSEGPRSINRAWTFTNGEHSERRITSNLRYIGQLLALKAWYQEVRLRRIPPTRPFNGARIVIEEAIHTLCGCIEERINRFHQFVGERGARRVSVPPHSPPCPLEIVSDTPYTDHIEWVRRLSDDQVRRGEEWLDGIAWSVERAYYG